MKELNNPFVVYGYKGARYFCDREKETEKIIKGLTNERNIALIAPGVSVRRGWCTMSFHILGIGSPTWFVSILTFYRPRRWSSLFS